MGSWSTVLPALDSLLGLVLPVECPGCGAWDVPLCGGCAGAFGGPPRRCEDRAPALGDGGPGPPLAVWALAEYSGAARGLVLAWKGRNRADLARFFSSVGRAAGAALGDGLAARVPHAARLWLVPAPSGRRRRARGGFVVGPLAAAVAAGLADSPAAAGWFGVAARDVLRRRAGRARQSGLGAAGRVANRAGRTVVRAGLPVGAMCLIVDDVMTSGATIRSAAEALTAAGHTVVGAVVLAVAPDPRRGR